LLQRLKQVGVSAGVATNNISIVDSAEPSLFPHEPSLPRNLAIGLAAGLFLGLCIVFVIEFLDDSIKFPDEVERMLGLPLMGIIPKVGVKRADKSVALEVHDAPRSTFAEAYRSVRTALQFSTPEGAPKRLVVTSSTRNEGKSTTALALAINFAQLGQRVLLIDGDMRNPSVHKLLGMANDFGLSNLLSSEGKGERMILPTTVPNLSVLTAGPAPPNPVDLLLGPKLLLLLNVTATLGIDYVIVDAPPLLGIADSIVLGNQLQNILFVVQGNRTRKSHIKSALRRLRLAGLLPRGVVLTQTLRGAMNEDYGSYYGYGPADDIPTVRNALP
jgi:polysaccharide biosynthesis transport protein